MRADMFEVIIERPRGGAGRGKENRRTERSARAWDAAPRCEGMGRRPGAGTKYLNENLAPLLRFLRRRVGRPWDAVRSEMAAVLSMSSAVQKHVLDHVRQYVREDVELVDGVPYAITGTRPLSERWRGGFFVCPKTGILRHAPRPPRGKAG